MSENASQRSLLWKEQRNLFLIGKRKCRMCGKIKELSDFYRLRASGFYYSFCKKCSTSKWKDSQKNKYHSDVEYKKHSNFIVKRNIERKRKEVLRLLGNHCKVCRTKKRLNCHEIHGKKHSKSPYYILKHLEDFVLLDNSCHSAVHTYFENRSNFEKIIKDVDKRCHILKKVEEKS